MRVGVNLTSLGAGANYILYHNDPYHPNYHYGTVTALTNLPLIANDYKAQYYPDDPNGNGGSTPIPEADKLNFNDMSLVDGGKFKGYVVPGVQAAWDPTLHTRSIGCGPVVMFETSMLRKSGEQL